MTTTLEIASHLGEEGHRAYNYERFRTKHLLADFARTLRSAGVRPGEPAPDFTLASTMDEPVRLGNLRGRPVLLHFGSLT